MLHAVGLHSQSSSRRRSSETGGRAGLRGTLGESTAAADSRPDDPGEGGGHGEGCCYCGVNGEK